jgi:hypothetical protein
MMEPLKVAAYLKVAGAFDSHVRVVAARDCANDDS